jgi:hypothetical protein
LPGECNACRDEPSSGDDDGECNKRNDEHSSVAGWCESILAAATAYKRRRCPNLSVV